MTHTIHAKYALTHVLNAHGTFTPLGVSRSSPSVQRAVAAALGEFFIIDELQAAVSERVARITGAEAATVTHCTAAAITLAIAATMTGDSETGIAQLPDTTGMPNRVIIPAGHVVNYGHSILTAIRLAGAVPVIAGTQSACTVDDISHALVGEHTACLLLVSSRLAHGTPLDLGQAVAAAHACGLPAVIDGAAQDLRLDELLATGADLVLVSAQKYLAAPTAGLIVGRRDLVRACRAQERGIGRGMKATKESIAGVLAALEEREHLDVAAWRAEQDRKVRWFVEQADAIAGLTATAQEDPTELPFLRVCLHVEPSHRQETASALSRALRQGSPSIWVVDRDAAAGNLILELGPLTDTEIAIILSRLAVLSEA